MLNADDRVNNDRFSQLNVFPSKGIYFDPHPNGQECRVGDVILNCPQRSPLDALDAPMREAPPQLIPSPPPFLPVSKARTGR